ncbi:hypothetical protein EYF80_065528 [Liparis tanakae]|uniref:Uncharacterized protein n=1 Tax=Liparis tanakae TaxID=230148 RepID=A0A4Z2E6D1_9TELE|nr:hypothetical protein EYF80_065528 [Liparis tanakae]
MMSTEGSMLSRKVLRRKERVHAADVEPHVLRGQKQAEDGPVVLEVRTASRTFGGLTPSTGVFPGEKTTLT